MGIMYYIDYRANRKGNVFNRLYSKLYPIVKIAQMDGNKKAITISTSTLSGRLYKRIDKMVYEIDMQHLNSNVLVSNRIKYNEGFFDEFTAKEKYTMKALLPELIGVIEKTVDTNFKLENVYVAVNTEKSLEIVTYIAPFFRAVNIVTTKLGKLRALEDRLDTISCNYAVSNNRRKSLDKAKLFINLDFNNDILRGFHISRNCIVVNLNRSVCCFKSSFHGTVIDSIDISYNNKYENYIDSNNFDAVKLYDSFIQSDKYCIARAQCLKDKCKIEKLLGPINPVNEKEIKNNYIKNRIKLDKL